MSLTQGLFSVLTPHKVNLSPSGTLTLQPVVALRKVHRGPWYFITPLTFRPWNSHQGQT